MLPQHSRRFFTLWAVSLPLAAQSLLLLPEYAPASIVNAASQRAGKIAPNSIFTIYGKNLSFSTWALGPSDIRNGFLPTDLPGLNVSVLVRGIAVPLYFVSPNQINALIPAEFSPGIARLEVRRGSAAGPRVEIQIVSDALELFSFENGWAAATHPNGSTVDATLPVRPGQYVVLYGTAWGATDRSEFQAPHIAANGALLRRWPDFRVYLANRELPRDHLWYAGLTPGFAGLYQVNFKVPEDLTESADCWLQIGQGELGAKVKLRIAPATESPPQAFQP